MLPGIKTDLDGIRAKSQMAPVVVHYSKTVSDFLFTSVMKNRITSPFSSSLLNLSLVRAVKNHLKGGAPTVGCSFIAFGSFYAGKR